MSGERGESRLRFYVWQQGWRVQSSWREVPPEGVDGLRDCTDMDDGEFDQMMHVLQEQELRHTSPGDPS